MGLQRIGSLAELRDAKAMKAEVDAVKLAIFLVGDDVVVTNGKCPHANGPLHDGEVDGHVLTCPWHGWTYDLRNGACEEDPELVLEIHESVVEGDDILVRL